MKSLLFVIPSYNIGGTTVSTINLISLLNRQNYCIYILPMCEVGELKNLYNKYQIIKPNVYISSISRSNWRSEPNVLKKYYGAILRKLSHQVLGFERYILKFGINKILKKYQFDTVISCQEGLATKFVSYFNCDNKIAWVRCDYRSYLNITHKNSEIEIYSKYNSIICVSIYTTNIFYNIYPQLKDKIHTINNPQNTQYIINRGNIRIEDTLFIKRKTSIVSVGRFDPIKRFSKIPEIAYQLKRKGVDFVWYIIGPKDNVEGENVIRQIEKYNVKNEVVLLGEKINPHQYIKQSDILVCLSVSEACPRIINEAKILGIPTICTDFPSAKEFIDDGENGIIVSLENIGNAIMNLIIDTVKYNKIKEAISQFKFDNNIILRKINNLL